MPFGFLLLLAAVILIVLNPFSGAVTIGVIIAALAALFTLVSVFVIAFVWKGVTSERERFKF